MPPRKKKESVKQKENIDEKRELPPIPIELVIKKKVIDDKSEDKSKDKSEDKSEDKSYDNLIPKHPYRENVYKKILNILIENNKEPYNFMSLEIQKYALNIERGIFNYAIDVAHRREWDHVFKFYYTSKAVRICTNINPKSYIKNIDLIHRFFKKEFNEFDLCRFDSEQLFPSRYYEIIKEYEQNLPQYSVPQEPTNDGAHFCGKCKTHKTTYYQLQTRSAKIIGWKSTLLITSWLCYLKNSCRPSLILKC